MVAAGDDALPIFGCDRQMFGVSSAHINDNLSLALSPHTQYISLLLLFL